ncbi:sigma-70 family RNA polymerase sigma factor [Thalassotalea sp. G20_0]|uniref:sigma-70 family RNA polymerase sigma factor n=1 Tax=Thalassotalea sp. G20_0 TaxID=2821093 RepID=UPI001ADC0634|nr:sigma-70 family RNA polymerase sigma factor [Thalassotalea sp. G20_0]MBO9496969.1 sigma-70 family RNA polymerase sigma factor [Thalassotalea sp. G20_0]
MKGKTKLREVFRLKFEHHLSERKIAQSCNISRSTVKDYLARLSVSELTWPLPESIDEHTLEQHCSPSNHHQAGTSRLSLTGVKFIRHCGTLV